MIDYYVSMKKRTDLRYSVEKFLSQSRTCFRYLVNLLVFVVICYGCKRPDMQQYLWLSLL